MREMRQEEEPCRFHSGMAGLDNLLREGEILPDKNVDIRRFVALVEAHENLLKGDGKFDLIGWSVPLTGRLVKPLSPRGSASGRMTWFVGQPRVLTGPSHLMRRERTSFCLP